MQIMFGTIICVLLKSFILTKATITFMPRDYNTSNSFQEESVAICPYFIEDISMSEKSDHYILNFKSDRSHSDSTVRKRKDDEVTLANISVIPETIKSGLNKPTSLRAFVQFDSPFTEKINDIFVTLRWDQPEFTNEIIQGYTLQCFFIENLKEIQICDDKNITTTELEHTVHNLTFNATYYFRVRAHTKIVAGPYTDLISVSTTYENPVPKLLLKTYRSVLIWDVDLNRTNFVSFTDRKSVVYIAYCIQDNRIYWTNEDDLMTFKINENNITKIATLSFHINDLCIDWVARNLYLSYSSSDSYILKFDITMWENDIIKFDEIYKISNSHYYLSVSPFMGILYGMSYNWINEEYNMTKYYLDGRSEQIVQINSSFCLSSQNLTYSYAIDNTNNEEPLIYWLCKDRIFVTDINVSMSNTILHNPNAYNTTFRSITIDKTNIYIGAFNNLNQRIVYVFEKKFANLKSVSNSYKCIVNIEIGLSEDIEKIYVSDRSLQPYPPMRCLTPDEKVYNFENVNATGNSIVVNLPESVAKSGCKKYNLPTTMYTIFVSCLDNNLNKSEKFNVQTFERYYEIQNLTPFTEYMLKFTLSNFYFDQLSINPFDSNVISIKTNSGKLNAPENISVLALTPTMAVVYWMPPKKVNCVAVTYEVHWKTVTSVNGTQQKDKQMINVPKRVADGRFFAKINLSLPVEDYLIYVRAYPFNFSDFYSERLSEIVHTYSEPNNISLNEIDAICIDISWISNINLTIFSTLEYKDVTTDEWQTTKYIKMNYNNEAIYRIGNLQPRTSYVFRLRLSYLEYAENFTWPADKRFIFLTPDIWDTPGIMAREYYLLLVSSFIVIIIIPFFCFFYCLYRQHRSNNEQFLSSTMTDIEWEILHEVSYQYNQFNTIYSPMLHYNPNECAITKIARKQIIFGKLIGSGAFGMVYQGKVKNLEKSGTETSVAIKTIRKDASFHEKKKLLKEALLMNRFRHEHILRLLAVCLDGDSPLLVLELMETGDLLTYLKDCRNLQASDSHALRLQDLLAMCEDVARGCCYLEELRFVHRDLACRNCLLSSRNRKDRVIKIGDFGLARDLYKDDYYRMGGEVLLPVRWMAPESLMINIFTSQSDVWSFGVLMWEITSLGEQPYIGKANEEVINYVRVGGRLPITLNCPSALYQLMLRCWSAADARPNFEFCLKNIIALRKNIKDALLSPVDAI
ncbi:proto-oncogene tyrosine-protein kinase ROS isoform X2 [Camponotus floridanus]|uniref:proto-oncogene tyrosine-protein kinase ROS isoform X2 n=1 Tax=Camponotus floridanus TaxID=104421 RepID=UPI000DC6C338|nr:proto-oncogene tyrosine-protein kinase ROS isoform X2 [Camponotus floridanus]